LGQGQVQKLLRTGQVRVDGARARAAHRLLAGQTVRIPPMPQTALTPARSAAPPPPVTGQDRRALEGALLHMDPSILVLNKPPGLAVQGGTGTRRHLDAMLDVLRYDAAERPRLVHRLDRDTSGVLLLARSGDSARSLGRMFRDHVVTKLYWALTVGVPPVSSGYIDMPLAKLPGRAGERMTVDQEGRSALTRFAVLATIDDRVAWLAVWPESGRTHQIRAHLAALGTPVLGDGKYGRRQAFLQRDDIPRRLHLHARALRLPTGQGIAGGSWFAPVPPHFRNTMDVLGFDARRTGLADSLEAPPGGRVLGLKYT
ncbi:MAG: RluA family pseudouridine synthase, partial [Alphaproteobacteria bacterium]